MAQKESGYWEKPPPAGLYEGLLDSGIISRKVDVPVVHHEVTPNIRPRSVVAAPIQAKPAGKTLRIPKPKPNPLSGDAFSHYRPKTSVGFNIEAELANSTFANNRMHEAAQIESYKSREVRMDETAPPPTTFVEEFESKKRNVGGRREAKALLRDLDAMVANYGVDSMTSASPTEQNKVYKQLLSSYLFIWNQLILQLKSHSEDYAILSQKIKAFFQGLLQKMPEMEQRYESHIEEITQKLKEKDEENRALKEKNSEQNARIATLSGQNEKLKVDIELGKSRDAQNKETYGDLLFKLDEQKTQLDDMIFKNGKLEELKLSMETQIKQKDQIIESNNKQISAQEKIITKYEEEGAGFKPMYMKAQEEFAQLKQKYDIQAEELRRMKGRRVDAQTEPIPELQEFVRKAKKKQVGGKGRAKGKGLSLDSDNSSKIALLSPGLDSRDPSPSKGKSKSGDNDSSSRSSQGSTQGDHVSLSQAGRRGSRISLRAMQVRPKVIQEAGSNHQLRGLTANLSDREILSLPEKLSASVPQFNPADLSTESLPQAPTIEELLESSPAPSPEKNPVEEKPTEKPSEPKTPEPKPVESQKPSPEKPKKPKGVPEDYNVAEDVIDQHDTRAMLAYVDRMFPLPLSEPIHVPASQYLLNQIQKRRFEVKSFSWTLQQVIFIMRNGFEVDSFVTSSMNFLDIIRRVITRSGKSSHIVERIEANLLGSLFQHQTRSNAMQFFMLFVSGEYGITDYRFFNMLFDLCFNAIYPSIEGILGNDQLADDFQFFFIHKQFFDSICRLMLRKDKFPEENMKNIMNDMPQTDYPDLVPFFLFAREMISLFKEVHVAFHKQIKNMICVLGAGEVESVSKDRFTEFLRLVDPVVSDVSIKDMWDRLSMQLNDPEKQEYTYQLLLKYCGEFTDLVRMVVELPQSPDFDRNFRIMSDAMTTLYFFLRRRFTDHLPNFLSHLSRKIREYLTPYIIRMRNAFFKVDVSACLMCYRYVMQYVDLKLTEDNPFQVVTANVSNEDVTRIINHIMMRECLASILMGICSEQPEDTLINREIELNQSKQ